MKASLAKKVAFIVVLFLAFPITAFASMDPPWGFPECAQKGNGSIYLPGPIVAQTSQYSGIYKAVEQYIAPLASYFFPVMVFDEHRNYVRITRIAGPNGSKPKKKVFAFGGWHYLDSSAPLSMRIDKCDGRISEVFFDTFKLK